MKHDVPDILFYTDNELDIPVLDLNLQAEYPVMPMLKWGFTRRGAIMPGTYHFYVEDYKFQALWNDPQTLVLAKPYAVVEPNFSTNEQMPAAVAHSLIYKKRWLARYWQTQGIRVWVDVCVAVRFAFTNLFGVPVGWKSYCTRGYADEIDHLDFEFDMACQRAQTSEINFLVYGGGAAVRSKCEKSGWSHVPEQMHVFDGRLNRQKVDIPV